jgi:hypothetical protein
VVLPLLAFALDFLIPAQMASAGDMEATLHLISEAMSPTIHPVALALLVLTAAGVAGNLLYLSLMPGQAGPNQYGPDPRDGVAAPGVTPIKSSADDFVDRALADYHARQKSAAVAPASARPAQAAPGPAASFGKKRR